jgi:hypothetical protein
MAYHKRPATTRSCVHCHDAYQAVDRRRLYCSSSCKVQACKAKRRRRLAAKADVLAAKQLPLAGPAAAGTTPPKPSAQTLEWNLQNIAVLGTAAALGNLGVKAGERLVNGVKQPQQSAAELHPPAQVQLVEPLNWLPAGLLTGDAPRVPITSTATGQAHIFVQLQYLGHTLYYQPTQRLLLWRAAPGELRLLTGPEQVALMAEQIPCDTELQQTSAAHALAPGRMPKFLG